MNVEWREAYGLNSVDDDCGEWDEQDYDDHPRDHHYRQLFRQHGKRIHPSNQPISPQAESDIGFGLASNAESNRIQEVATVLADSEDILEPYEVGIW